jgi:hypothetical protein
MKHFTLDDAKEMSQRPDMQARLYGLAETLSEFRDNHRMPLDVYDQDNEFIGRLISRLARWKITKEEYLEQISNVSPLWEESALYIDDPELYFAFLYFVEEDEDFILEDYTLYMKGIFLFEELGIPDDKIETSVRFIETLGPIRFLGIQTEYFHSLPASRMQEIYVAMTEHINAIDDDTVQSRQVGFKDD